MTIEGRPEIVGSQEFLNKTYEAQRKCRMQDAIDDYLQDKEIAPEEVYNEILDCIDDVINYHEAQMDRASDLKLLLKGKLK